MDASPAKRRVLGALDANACSPKVRRDVKLAGLSPVKMKAAAPRQTVPASTSPTRVVSRTPDYALERDSESRKRLSPTSTPGMAMAPRDDGPEDGEPAAKRPCLDDARENIRSEQAASGAESPPSSTSTTRTTITRHRSASPYTPSVFDTSAVDNSQVTILTEPDTSGPAPVPAPAPVAAPAPRLRPRLTREQAREKAEILRLRLGLASYKVRTGQTDVPLDRLEAQLLRPSSRPSLSRASASASLSQQQTGSSYQSGGATSVSASFPPASGTGNVGGGRRRPLPGAPLRRASSGASVSFAEHEEDVEDEAVPAPPPLRRALEEEWRAHPNAPHTHTHTHTRPHSQHSHHHHQRRQSEALLNTLTNNLSKITDAAAHRRRYSSSAARPRTATEGLAPPPPGMFRAGGRSSSFVVGEELGRENGEEDRGGAASGLLSLARS